MGRMNNVEVYVREINIGRRGKVDQVKRVYLNRENWRLFCYGHSIGESSRIELL